MSNEEKKDTVLQEEANKVAEDAAKEKAEAVDAQAADEALRKQNRMPMTALTSRCGKSRKV